MTKAHLNYVARLFVTAMIALFVLAACGRDDDDDDGGGDAHDCPSD
jgi:hypothetical protein